MQTSTSMINNQFSNHQSYNSIASKREEITIPEDIEFDIRFLNMFNLFFGLKRAVFTKKKTTTGSRDLFEEFEKNFMTSMKVLSCQAFDTDSSITKRYCKLIDDVLILNKYVRHNPKKVKKISQDLLNALDKNLNPLKGFWGDENSEKMGENALKKSAEESINIKKSLDFENYLSGHSKEILQPRESNSSVFSEKEKTQMITMARRKSVEKYPNYRYSNRPSWERGTQSGQKSSRDYFKEEGLKFRSNVMKKINFGDVGSAIKKEEPEDVSSRERDLQLISLISLDESLNGEESPLPFNEKLDVL